MNRIYLEKDPSLEERASLLQGWDDKEERYKFYFLVISSVRRNLYPIAVLGTWIGILNYRMVKIPHSIRDDKLG